MHRAIKAGDLAILIVALALLIVLAAVSYLVAPPPGNDLRGSTYSSRGDGAKAAFLLLKQLGYTIERSFEPIAAVHAEPSETVLVIASPSLPSSIQDRRALRAFLDRGGIVIATGGGASFLPGMAPELSAGKPVDKLASDKLASDKLDSLRSDKPAPPTPYRAAMPSLLTRGAPTVLFDSEIIGVAPPTSVSYIALYTESPGPESAGPESAGPKSGGPTSAGGAAGVLTARFGDGRAIWAIGSTPFLNRDIDKPGHLEFLLNAIGPREEGRVVLWDEYYHGYDRGLASYLASTNLSTAFAQLALMALAALFTFSRRRGPLRPLAIEPRASAMEFVDAVSSLYQKARASSGAVETMRARLRRTLIAASQMPASSSDAQLAAAAAARYPVDEGEVRDVLAASAAAGEQATLPADQALLLVQRMQAVATKTLAQPGSSRSPRRA
jgi:hypothetical protein